MTPTPVFSSLYFFCMPNIAKRISTDCYNCTSSWDSLLFFPVTSQCHLKIVGTKRQLHFCSAAKRMSLFLKPSFWNTINQTLHWRDEILVNIFRPVNGGSFLTGSAQYHLWALKPLSHTQLSWARARRQEQIHNSSKSPLSTSTQRPRQIPPQK